MFRYANSQDLLQNIKVNCIIKELDYIYSTTHFV